MGINLELFFPKFNSLPIGLVRFLPVAGKVLCFPHVAKYLIVTIIQPGSLGIGPPLPQQSAGKRKICGSQI